ncbi:glycosyltransferase family 2 protein [Ferrimonas kyonanensis]|uniref:glycosyltransferase family 2 protein n=1 Tax=Ferrimonas kyonanensis TaxID=364763 RepID=UPI0005516023|nr:glycosyltransferase [Ferrimonas kyonanensis]
MKINNTEIDLVSIITPLYNSKKYLLDTYNSIRAQSYSNWEWLVTDDRSNDGSFELICELAKKDPRIKVHRNEVNSGAAVSRNRCIENSKGRYLAFLDSDDLWLPCKLKVQIDFMRQNNTELCYMDYGFIDEDGNKKDKVRTTPDSVDYIQLLRENIIGCLTVIYDTKRLGKVFMPLIRKRQDYGLWLQILKVIEKADRCPGVHSLYRQRKNSVSSNKFEMVKYNFCLFREHQGMGTIRASYWVSINILSKLFKRNKVRA